MNLYSYVACHTPWNRKENLEDGDIAKEKLIMREGGSGTREVVESFLKIIILNIMYLWNLEIQKR
nr:hypothetical protein [Clostridium butyricum]